MSQILNKQTLLNYMPLIAVAIIVLVYFLPLALGELVFAGFILGSLGKAAFPYYRKWKDGDEELLFNFAYLIPVVIAIGVATLSYLSGFILYVIPANAPLWLAYGGAILFAFGGAEMLNELLKYWDFFHDLWDFQTQLSNELNEEFDDAIEETYEEEEEPIIEVEMEETEEEIFA